MDAKNPEGARRSAPTEDNLLQDYATPIFLLPVGKTMPDTTSLTLFLIAALTLNVTPGPDMLYVIARSLGQGRKAGVISAIGIGIGALVHTLAAAVGLSALLYVFSDCLQCGEVRGCCVFDLLGRSDDFESETQSIISNTCERQSEADFFTSDRN